MKGIIIHMGGRIWRSVGGRGDAGRLSVVPVMRVGVAPAEVYSRPIRLIFYDGGRRIASSSRVRLAKGRRYPGVEHWFVLPEEDRWAEAFAALRETPAPPAP